MLFRQRRSRSELNASQTAPSVLESPRASIDHMSVQFPDISKMKSTLDGESGTRKVEPDIQFFSLDMTQFLSSLVVQIKKLYKLLENFKSSVQEIAVTATDQSSLPSDDASERAIKGVGSNNSVDLTKGSDALLHTDQFWIDPSEDFVQHNHTGDHVKNTLSGEELKAFLALCKACEADLHLFFEKVGEAILNFYLDDESSSRLEAVLVLATKLLSKLQEAANFTGACVDEQVESQFQERSRQSSSKQPSKHTRVWFQMPDGDFTLLWVDPSEDFLKHTHSGQVFDHTSLVKKLEVEHGDAKIGGKNKKQSRQAQAKKDVQAREEARAQQQPQTSIEEESIHEIFSRDGRIPKDWTLKKGFVIGPVLDQMKDEICWAIVLVRLLQAIYNIGRPINQQVEFSIDELVDQIKPGEEKNLQLSNLNLALNHIRTQGVMKKPTTKKGSEKAGALGCRIKRAFKLCKDVDASFVQEKLDRFPVGLCLEITDDLEYLTQEKIYILPKKRNNTREARLHMVLIVGYGFTKDGQLFFIIQNSWGDKWSLRGFARIIIHHKCDVIALDE